MTSTRSFYSAYSNLQWTLRWHFTLSTTLSAVAVEAFEDCTTEVVRVNRHQRNLSCTTQRNSFRPRLETTKVGNVELKIQKASQGHARLEGARTMISPQSIGNRQCSCYF